MGFVTVILLEGEPGVLWPVSKINCKYRPPFNSAAAMPVFEKMMMYSALCASFFANHWTTNHTRRSCHDVLVPISSHIDLPLCRNMDFLAAVSDWQCCPSSPRTSSEHAQKESYEPREVTRSHQKGEHIYRIKPLFHTNIRYLWLNIIWLSSVSIHF